MTWNYRVVKDKDGIFGLKEVYSSNDQIEGTTEKFMSPFGTSMEELRADFELMKKAFDKPILVETENGGLEEL